MYKYKSCDEWEIYSTSVKLFLVCRGRAVGYSTYHLSLYDNKHPEAYFLAVGILGRWLINSLNEVKKYLSLHSGDPDK